MAVWTPIPDSALEPDSPARSVDAIALRENPKAIAEGASGAPRILHPALQQAELGDTVVCRLDAERLLTRDGDTEYEHLNERGERTVGARMLVGGAIRVTLIQSSETIGGRHFVRIMRNDQQIAEWETPGPTVITEERSADFSVQRGDNIIVQVRTRENSGGQSRVSNIVIKTAPNCTVVAA